MDRVVVYQNGYRVTYWGYNIEPQIDREEIRQVSYLGDSAVRYITQDHLRLYMVLKAPEGKSQYGRIDRRPRIARGQRWCRTQAVL